MKIVHFKVGGLKSRFLCVLKDLLLAFFIKGMFQRIRYEEALRK
jgi:hypothetical protein